MIKQNQHDIISNLNFFLFLVSTASTLSHVQTDEYPTNRAWTFSVNGKEDEEEKKRFPFE